MITNRRLQRLSLDARVYELAVICADDDEDQAVFLLCPY